MKSGFSDRQIPQRGIIPVGITLLLLFSSLMGLAFSYQVLKTPLTTTSNAQICSSNTIVITEPNGGASGNIEAGQRAIRWSSNNPNINVTYNVRIRDPYSGSLTHISPPTNECATANDHDTCTPDRFGSEKSYTTSFGPGQTYEIWVNEYNAACRKWITSGTRKVKALSCVDYCTGQGELRPDCEARCNPAATATPTPVSGGGAGNPTATPAPGPGGGGGSCSCQVPKDPKDNFCGHDHNTPNCPMTAPHGYCDPDGDGSYADAKNVDPATGKTGWQRGYEDYKAQCSSAGGNPTSTPPPGGNPNDCFSAMKVDPSTVSSGGPFICGFNFGSTLSGKHLNCVILKNGQLASGGSCIWKQTQGKTVSFDCTAPSANDTYDVVGYLDANNQDGETLPSTCSSPDIKGTLTVGSAGGGGGGGNPTAIPTTVSGGVTPMSTIVPGSTSTPVPVPTGSVITSTLAPTQSAGSCSAAQIPSIAYPPQGGAYPGPFGIGWNPVPGARTYALRIDDMTNPWNGSCTNPNPGDQCVDDIPADKLSYEVMGVEGHTYHFWLHSINYCNEWSASKDRVLTIPLMGDTTTCRVQGYRTIIQPFDPVAQAGKSGYSYDSKAPNYSLSIWVPDAVKASTISVNGVTPLKITQANPYFIVVPGGQSYTVKIDPVPGYTISSTFCPDSIYCHLDLTNNPTLQQGNSRTFVCPAGKAPDLWWNFTPVSIPTVAASPAPAISAAPTGTPQPTILLTETPVPSSSPYITPGVCDVPTISWTRAPGEHTYSRAIISISAGVVVENIKLTLTPLSDISSTIEISTDGGSNWQSFNQSGDSSYIVTIQNRNTEVIHVQARAKKCDSYSNVLTLDVPTVPLTSTPMTTPVRSSSRTRSISPALVVGGALLLGLVGAALYTGM